MMKLIVLAFGAFAFLAGLLVLVKPAAVIGYLRGALDQSVIYILAITVRFVMGVLLLMLAAQSKFPLVVTLLGWILVASAVVFLGMGRERFSRLLRWVLEKFAPFAWIGGLLGMGFGVFLIVAFT